MLQQQLDAAASTPKGKTPSPMKRKYMEAFQHTMLPPVTITPGTSGKKKKGKSERAKLVEKLAHQNMKVYDRLHAGGIMETPKDLSDLDNFIKHQAGPKECDPTSSRHTARARTAAVGEADDP